MVHKLRTNRFLATRAILHQSLFLGCLLGLIAGCGSKKSSESGSKNLPLVASSSPEEFRKEAAFANGLDSSLDKIVNWNPVIDRELMRLANYLEMTIEGRSDQSEFTAANLTYSGIDRQNAANTFSGDRTRVTRWRRTKDSPGFLDDGLTQLVDNLYSPWRSASSFRTELTAHEIERNQDSLSVTVIARSTGLTSKNAGLESTSMWKTQWEIASDLSDDLDLRKIQVLAHEVTEIDSPRRTLFQDATANIIRNDDCFSKQLAYGLDDWAKWIPGIDIMGNHGIAIGDPNNDGFEDIYLCQPEGLPNLLISQRSDGSAGDIAQETGTNLLDESRAALFVDLDNDGDEDLVVSTKRELLLMSNNGNGEFQLEHRVHNVYDGGSISASDFDLDGDLDLFVCRYQPMLHEGDFFPHPNDFLNAQNGGPNVLLRNDEGWSFQDVTTEVGLQKENKKFSRCGLWIDFDQDGDQDLYVVNQFSSNQLFKNDKGQFSLDGKPTPFHDASSSRSGSLGDYNADGKMDIFIAAEALPEAKRLDLQSTDAANGTQSALINSLAKESRVVYSPNDEQQSASSYRLPAPIFASQMTFGSANLDINNDGYDDVIITNGQLSRSRESLDSTLELSWIQQLHASENPNQSGSPSEPSPFDTITRSLSDEIRRGASFGEHQRNVCLLGLGPIGFANFSSLSGIDFPDDGRAVATVDWDQDGDLDVIINSRTAPQIRILLNQLESDNQSISVRLKGTQSNRDAIGARVELYLADRKSPVVQTVNGGSGTLSQSSKVLHFGIPSGNKIKRMVIHWPAGLTQTFKTIQSGSRYEVTEGADKIVESKSRIRLNLSRPAEPVTPEELRLEKSIFYPPRGLPSLQYQVEQQSWMPLRSVNETPTFAMFIDDSPESLDLLKSIAREVREFEKANLDVVAIGVSGNDPDSVQHFDSTETMIEKANFPFRYGAASKSMLDKMERLYGDWHSDQKMPDPPFAWLIDRQGKISFSYSTGNVQASTALNDLTTMVGGLKKNAKRTNLRPGIWMSTTPVVNYGRISNRFADLGYQNDQEAFALHSRPYLALQLCRSAIESKLSGNQVDSRSEFTQALELDPRCELAFLEFGDLLLDQVEDEVDEVVRQSLLNEGQILFEKANELDPANPRAILGLAKVAKIRNQIDFAISQLKDFLKIHDNHWDVHATIGRLYFDKGEYTKSTSHLLKAYTQRPTLPYVAGDLGFLYLNGGLYQEARSLLRVANKLQPSDVRLKQNLAQSEFLMGDYEVSIKFLREIVSKYPEKTVANSLLAWLLATAPDDEQRNGEESLEISTRLLEKHGDLASIHEICAAGHAELGDFDQAVKLQQKAIDLLESVSPESYSKPQREGLRARMEMYEKKRAYRIDDIRMIPIRQPGT